MTQNKIALIDYGLGNLFSVERALKAVQADYKLTDNHEDLLRANKLILPGVGAFSDGMKGLLKRQLIKPIKQAVNQGKPLLGICLGMQLLMETGHEFGKHAGLDLISGEVKPIKTQEKLPQIGWNQIKIMKTDSLLEGVSNKTWFYFVHSYVIRPKNNNSIVAVTDYGGDNFCSIIRNRNIYGVQFHPEKSDQQGIKIYANFVSKI